MDRYLIKKLTGEEEFISEIYDEKYIVDTDELVNRLRTLKVHLDNWDLKTVFKILTGG